MEPSEIVLQGRRYCESISGYTLFEDLTWLAEENKWVIKFALKGDYEPTTFVPIETNWYAFLSADYPFGSLSILPAMNESIEATFPHMNYNSDIGKPWRSGDICVKTNYGSWKSAYFNREPFDVSRLQWSIKRAKAWIYAAANGTLFSDGDPFEFPHFTSGIKTRVAFSETLESFSTWSSLTDNGGVVDIFRLPLNNNITVVNNFYSDTGSILSYEWGIGISENQPELERALWYRFPEIPVLQPWRMAMNWGELFNLCKSNGWDLKSFLENKLIKSKYLDKTKLLVLGFPVSAYIGKPNERMHWFAVRLPGLIKTLRGFRPNTPEWRQANFSSMFAGHQSIKWLNAENWAKDQITTRGALSDQLNELNICVIGVGAVGSYLSELLARLGCKRFALVDDDGVSIGNFSRHTLTMESLVRYKAEKVAERLNNTFPHISASSRIISIQKLISEEPEFLNKFDLIIDCTAEDNVLQTLELNCISQSQVVLSVSVGQEAQSLLAFMIRFPFVDIFQEFKKKSKDWSERQKQLFPNPQFPLEGIGCWHPIFPARIDDLHSLIAPVVRQLETFLSENEHLKMAIIEREANGNIVIENKI